MSGGMLYSAASFLWENIGIEENWEEKGSFCFPAWTIFFFWQIRIMET